MLGCKSDAFKLAGKPITYPMQQNQLPQIKKTRIDLKQVHRQVLQDALKRLDKAFEAFFRRIEKGEKPGYDFALARDMIRSLTPNLDLR
jgi:putative transposase